MCVAARQLRSAGTLRRDVEEQARRPARERGLFESRSRAAAAVMAGEVRLGGDGARAEKPGQLVADDVEVAVDERAAVRLPRRR